VVHGGSFSPPEKVIREATISLEEFKTANHDEQDLVQRQQRACSDVWKKPPQGVVKVNWDAAINKKEGYTGCGIIICDYEGQVLAARSITQVSIMDPTMAEAWAALQALLFSKEIGFFDAILEGDALQIVTANSIESPNWSRFGHFIEGIKEQALLFRSFSVSHVRREANSAAHLLAKAASTQVRDDVWLEELLHFLSDIVFKEATALFF
jgi:ribonuclease HI